MNKPDRIAYLVDKLGMLPHPEGGFYAETFRHEINIQTDSGERNLSTVIYFLLTSENVSKFHRIKSDEHWFWHEGSPLNVHLLNARGHQILRLGPVDNQDCQPQQLVPAKTIFGSSVEESDSYALVSCVVAPGFDFRDFELFSEDELLQEFPNESEIIRRLT
ncbi:cupin domain-containing protein [Algoriphagus kandeliae]|uniref:Cupin domain-containing protein n=1 Tax=Algoriphagus kandeliae TaxID=2562278 RepID=A0A4Y9QUZ7_9BACT|nr:cupin domain-containing protein [Algoriphagus kandeliae]TFV95518.1 cupin domain-containing protein [Algoriphagus kandeliae]